MVRLQLHGPIIAHRPTSVAIFVLSAVVLGISAFLASQFLPNIHHDFTIFALIPPSWTIFVYIILLLTSTPRVEAFFLFVTGTLWLSESAIYTHRSSGAEYSVIIVMGAWSASTLGSTKCESFGDATTPTTSGTMSARTYCDMSKVQEAFAWALLVLHVLFLFFVISLSSRSVAMGRRRIWKENINDLPWYGQAPSMSGYAEASYPGYPAGYQPQYYAGQAYTGQTAYTNQTYPGYAGMPQPQMSAYGGNVVQQQPGYATVIHPGSNGHPTHVEQIPSGMV
ncbi:hypothetical protein OF83DRAFT_86388 [Amylostereum chailletii]|nr:hypothetical protein OF83DRAFT_86388 [Amylostereum chailletii]